MGNWQNIPEMFSMVYTAAPPEVFWDMYENDHTFDEATQKQLDRVMDVDQDIFDDILRDTDDEFAIEKAIYQEGIRARNNQDVSGIETPYGPGLEMSQIDDLTMQYPGIRAMAGVNLDEMDNIFTEAEQASLALNPEIERMLDNAQARAEEEGSLDQLPQVHDAIGSQLEAGMNLAIPNELIDDIPGDEEDQRASGLGVPGALFINPTRGRDFVSGLINKTGDLFSGISLTPDTDSLLHEYNKQQVRSGVQMTFDQWKEARNSTLSKLLIPEPEEGYDATPEEVAEEIALALSIGTTTEDKVKQWMGTMDWRKNDLYRQKINDAIEEQKFGEMDVDQDIFADILRGQKPTVVAQPGTRPVWGPGGFDPVETREFYFGDDPKTAVAQPGTRTVWGPEGFDADKIAETYLGPAAAPNGNGMPPAGRTGIGGPGGSGMGPSGIQPKINFASAAGSGPQTEVTIDGTTYTADTALGAMILNYINQGYSAAEALRLGSDSVKGLPARPGGSGTPTGTPSVMEAGAGGIDFGAAAAASLTDPDADYKTNMKKVFYTQAYSYPGGTRSDLQADLKRAYYDSTVLFFLHKGLDVYGDMKKLKVTTGPTGLDATSSENQTYKNNIENNYALFLDKYFTNPDFYRSGTTFKSRLNLVMRVLSKVRNIPGTVDLSHFDDPRWQQDEIDNREWITAIFGGDDGKGYRRTLIKLDYTNGGSGLFAQAIHKAIDDSMNHYVTLGMDPEKVFEMFANRKSITTNELADAGNDADGQDKKAGKDTIKEVTGKPVTPAVATPVEKGVDFTGLTVPPVVPPDAPQQGLGWDADFFPEDPLPGDLDPAAVDRILNPSGDVFADMYGNMYGDVPGETIPLMPELGIDNMDVYSDMYENDDWLDMNRYNQRMVPNYGPNWNPNL